MMLSIVPALATSLLLAAVANAALPHITVKGSKFYTSSGEQFFIKGIAYQLDTLDTLQNTAQCELDAKLMKETGANAIRVYHVQEPVDHSGCMKAFEDIGVYVFVDLDTFSSDISQFHPQWTRPQLKSYQAVMDEFQKYDNTAGFFIGNEVLTMTNLSDVAPFIKASTRDLKAYRDSKGYRPIPIGYSSADIPALDPTLQNYLVCGDDELASIDFFGLNNYQWCGTTDNFESSGYSTLTDQIKNYPKPFFISETGCIVPEPRTFADQRAIFGPQMTPWWSGAIIYEWIMVENHYGIVAYNQDATNALSTVASFASSGTPIPVTPDFSNLVNVWKTVNPQSTPASAYTPHLTPPACPSYSAGYWEVAGDVVLPTLGEKLNPGVEYSITAGRHSISSHPTTHHHKPHTTSTSRRTRSTSSSSSKSSSTKSPFSFSMPTLPKEKPSTSSKSTSSNPPSTTKGHPKGKPHQTTALDPPNANGGNGGKSAANHLAAPPLFTRAAQYLANSHGEGQVFASMFALGSLLLGLIAWL